MLELSYPEPQVACLNLARPHCHNALTPELLDALLAHGETLAVAADDAEIKTLLLTGSGTSFCAGLDIKQVQADPQAIEYLLSPYHSTLLPRSLQLTRVQAAALIWRYFPVPVIAILQGHVLGGGLQIALGADIRLAAEDAQLGLLEMRHGLVPDMGFSQNALGLLQYDQLLKLILDADPVDAQRALALGLVTEVHPDPYSVGLALAHRWAQYDSFHLHQMKVLCQSQYQGTPIQALVQEESRIQKAILAG